MNGHSNHYEDEFSPRTAAEWAERQESDDVAIDAAAEREVRLTGSCGVCGGTGWMAYPHPDDDGGFVATAYDPCPACIVDDICPACGEGLMAWGALRICVHCGFTFDEAERPAARPYPF